MKIATWNVNSIRQRERHVASWLERHAPDVLVLQEIKCEAPQFPAPAFSGLGYRSEIVGQKSYNGVAVLARIPFEVTHRALPGLGPEDSQARYVEIVADGLTIVGIYLPNGNSGGDAGFAYKLAWMDALRARAAALLTADTDVAILGDYNVCPTDADYATRSSGRRAAPASAPCSGSGSPTRCGRSTPFSRCIRSGTTRRRHGRAIRACGSTTRCSRHDCPNACEPRCRTVASAGRNSRPTTCRLSSNSADSRIRRKSGCRRCCNREGCVASGFAIDLRC